MTKALALSVVIPNYNHSSSLREAVESCLNQSRMADEIILIDDHSSDDSWEIMKDFARRFPSIKIFRNEQNEGVVHCMNKGAKEATGDSILFRAADDISIEGSFEIAMALLERYREAGLCYGDCKFFSERPSDGTTDSLSLSPEPSFLGPEDLALRWKSDCIIHGFSVFVRKKALQDAQFFSPELMGFSDMFAFLVIAFRHGMVYTPTCLTAVRLSSLSYGNSILQNKKSKEKALLNIFKLIRKSYGDLHSMFTRTSALSIFGQDLLETYYKNPQVWSVENLHMLQRLQWDFYHKTHQNSKDDNHGISKVVRERLHAVRDEILKILEKSISPKVAIYGAGTHTEKLLNIWKELKFPPISLIVLSEMPNSKSFEGIPMLGIMSIAEENLDLIVLSSKSFEEIMLQNCEKFLPETPRLGFWRSESTNL